MTCRKGGEQKWREGGVKEGTAVPVPHSRQLAEGFARRMGERERCGVTLRCRHWMQVFLDCRLLAGKLEVISSMACDARDSSVLESRVSSGASGCHCVHLTQPADTRSLYGPSDDLARLSASRRSASCPLPGARDTRKRPAESRKRTVRDDQCRIWWASQRGSPALPGFCWAKLDGLVRKGGQKTEGSSNDISAGVSSCLLSRLFTFTEGGKVRD